MSAIVLRPFLICLAINQVQDSGAMAFMHFYVVSKINFCPVLSLRRLLRHKWRKYFLMIVN
jgi:hypothetical protein